MLASNQIFETRKFCQIFLRYWSMTLCCKGLRITSHSSRSLVSTLIFKMCKEGMFSFLCGVSEGKKKPTVLLLDFHVYLTRVLLLLLIFRS